MTNSNFKPLSNPPARACAVRLSRPRLMALPALLLALLVTLPLTGGHARAQEAAAAPATVNINEADAETLASALRGIGDARAVEIVRYREAYGPFTSVDELVEVRGIGQSTLDDNRALITLE